MNHRRDSPPTATVAPTAVDTRLPPAWHEQTERELDAAHADGYVAALRDLAERADALDTTWRPATRRDPEQVVAERAAGMIPAEGVDTWLARYHEHAQRHLDACVEAGRRADPIRTWADVRAYVTDAVWVRILGDLPATLDPTAGHAAAQRRAAA